MLLQHEGGVLRLFPDWPTKMDASFTRLRAKGAFLISSEQRAGAVRYVDVTSEKGGTLVIASPWKNNEVHVNADKAGGSLLQPDGTGRIKLTTQPGVSYHLNIQ